MRLAALVAAAAIGAMSLALTGAASPPASILTVSTTADVVNGDVSSPAALIASPGSDGISLREAITAADHATGRVAITFAPSLAGQTIKPTTSLPSVTHDDTALIGTTTADGDPAVTLDAGTSMSPGRPGFVNVVAAGVSVEHLRMVDVPAPDVGVTVWAGEQDGDQHVDDVRIEANVFDNGNAPGEALAMQVGTPNGHPAAVGATLSNVRIAHNLVRGFNGDGINVALPGTNCSLQSLLIERNTFANNTGAHDPALEIGTSFSGNTIVGTRIVGNTFTGNAIGLYIDSGIGGFNQVDSTPIPATGNTVTGTVATQNVFDGNQQAIAVVGGLGAASSTGNALVNTVISDNVVSHSASTFAAIYVFGGEDGASSNRVDGLQLVNDTIADNADGLFIQAGGAGNVIANLNIENTVLWMNGADVNGPDTGLAAIRSSLVGVDPRFVSAQDFHLQAGSPAIDAATSDAPAFDLEDRARVGVPDIGAYEFGAAVRPRLDVRLEEVGGTGTVTSSPAGIACGTTCEAAFDGNTMVTLTAAPAAASVFGGWSGACPGTGACTITLAAAASVTATFSPVVAVTPPPPPPKPRPTTVAVTVVVKGNGRVTGGGISCPARCRTTVTPGTKLSLHAYPARGYRFFRWVGACKGRGVCTLHPKSAVKVLATFLRTPSKA